MKRNNNIYSLGKVNNSTNRKISVENETRFKFHDQFLDKTNKVIFSG